ncbi:GNAT family N-acetyltransferase [Kineococcus sp. T13]|uniref:GNAT family N-acetyltransferase n=1 Tax=Kineococcus vitellinus TaxID=2696565 RepID=UPI0014133FC1|nr:GNAT family N-acetyltransferase [Kineococcus vitellinus]NAZ77759.1 GNAT family N-acetyltransferase [Kineococcus vitellinus]
MSDVREVPAGQTHLAAAAMLALRPRWNDRDGLVEVIDTQLRPGGYRLIGVFPDSVDEAEEAGWQAGEAVATAGFREVRALAWGHHLYVDDVSTLPQARGNGYADQLLTWLEAEARRLGCEGLHLDSGVGADRATAHRLYMRHQLRISAHHFEKTL